MFPERLKILRTEKGFTQNQLAEELGISNKTVSVYEKGTSSPTIETLINIARYFNVSVDYLVGYSNERNPQFAHLAQELCLTESAINTINELAHEINNTTGNPLSLTLSRIIEYPTFIPLIQVLDQYIAYSEDDWKIMGEKLFDSFSDSEPPYILKDPYTAKIMIFRQITEEFDEIIKSIFLGPPTPTV